MHLLLHTYIVISILTIICFGLGTITILGGIFILVRTINEIIKANAEAKIYLVNKKWGTWK